MTLGDLARRWSHRLDTGMSVGAFVVFAALWAGFVYAQAVDPGLPGVAWRWLRALDAGPQVVVWVATLPIPVGLWIWTSSWPPVIGAILGLGMIAWTVAAVAGLASKIRAR